MKIAIVGGGLVGALEACLLSKRGFQVTIFESRHDGRNEPTYYEHGIPMQARMIHKLNGKSSPIPYDPNGRCINSIERAHLNNFLLNKAEEQFNVELLFNHKLVDMNSETGELIFRVNSSSKVDDINEVHGEEIVKLASYQFDLILGCDGARSNVRSLLARQGQFEMRQSFIEHGYLELRIDANPDGSYKMPPNNLHIWPRGEYMMIALPNKDASFTCTLFMPMKIIDGLKEPKKGLEFFKQNFPDSVDLIGAERIMQTLSEVRASPLMTIKCSPYHYKGKVALLGDSAHAMVPFYGQGMNCGFEDCLVLDELLDNNFGSSGMAPTINGFKSKAGLYSEKMEIVLAEYTARRCANGHSMCELAMYNYIEMRHLVNTWSFAIRKHVDNLFYRLFPNKWIPLYTMVTFSRIPVDECVRRRSQQDKVIEKSIQLAGCLTLAGLLVTGLRLKRSIGV